MRLPWANAPRFQYTGGPYDSNTGNYLDGARYYSPSEGRFMSQDPLAFEAGDKDLYRYVFNTPLYYIDPSGEDIYVITGANFRNNPVNNSIHQDIVVDTPTGPRYFSFGQSGFGLYFSLHWLGSDSWTFCTLQGTVFEASAADRKGGTIVKQLKTTPQQDADFAAHLNGLKGTTDGYSAGRHNCRTFSQLMFSNAQKKYRLPPPPPPRPLPRDAELEPGKQAFPIL